MPHCSTASETAEMTCQSKADGVRNSSQIVSMQAFPPGSPTSDKVLNKIVIGADVCGPSNSRRFANGG